MKLTYTKQDNLLYPNIQVSNDQTDDRPLGPLGQKIFNRLKRECPNHYLDYLVEGTLMHQMHQAEKTAMDRFSELVEMLTKKHTIPKEPKARVERLKEIHIRAEQTAVQEALDSLK